jgi:hypothetical protein
VRRGTLKQLKEPKPRADGRCAVCPKKRKLPVKRLYREQAKLDPFCSADCCRAWYAEQVASRLTPSVGSGTVGASRLAS